MRKAIRRELESHDPEDEKHPARENLEDEKHTVREDPEDENPDDENGRYDEQQS